VCVKSNSASVRRLIGLWPSRAARAAGLAEQNAAMLHEDDLVFSGRWRRAPQQLGRSRTEELVPSHANRRAGLISPNHLASNDYCFGQQARMQQRRHCGAGGTAAPQLKAPQATCLGLAWAAGAALARSSFTPVGAGAQ